MEMELTGKIEGVKPLTLLAKERGKSDPTNDGCTKML